MCAGVESDQPGDCPRCGMALERATPTVPKQRVTYTCPMHPEVESEGPGECPMCGMALEAEGCDRGAGRRGRRSSRFKPNILVCRNLHFAGALSRYGRAYPRNRAEEVGPSGPLALAAVCPEHTGGALGREYLFRKSLEVARQIAA